MSRTISLARAASWPMNVTRPSGAHAARGGLAHVVEQRAEAQRLAARRARPPAARRAPRAARGASSPNTLLEPALELDLAREHLERVAVDVEVVVAALLHAVEVVQLGQHRAQRGRAGRPAPRPRSRRAPTTSRRSSPKMRSADASATRGAAARVSSSVCGVGREARARPRAAPAAACAAGRPRRRSATSTRSTRASRSAPPALRVDQRPRPPAGRAIALTLKSRRARSASIVSPWSGGDVVAAPRARGRAPARRRSAPRAGRPGRAASRRAPARPPRDRPPRPRPRRSTGRPSSSSRTVPPTTQRGARRPERREQRVASPRVQPCAPAARGRR